MNDIIRQLAAALEPALNQVHAERYGLGYKHDASGTPTAGYLHGPGGNFSFPGVDPAVFHTVIGNKGILGQLPAVPSVYTDPTFYVLTGVTGDTGDEKTTVCGNAPYGGLKKSCLLTAPFGRYERATREIELNRIGKRNDRADPMDLAMVGSPIHQSGIFSAGAQSPATPADLLVSEVRDLFWERNISIHRLLSQQLWVGSPANNIGQAYMEMTGFDTLITTGHVDAQLNTSCPSIDSDLKNFNYARLDGHCDDVVTIVTELYHHIKDIADRTGVMPVRWVFAMRPQLFYELTKCWPCSYLSYRCELPDNAELVVTGDEQVKMRDDMRTGRYLLIDGEKVDVVLDDGIVEWTNTTNASVTSGCFASDIYLIPMSVLGGRSVTYLEYFDFGNPQLGSVLGDSLVLGRVEGAFLTWVRQTNQCVVWQTKVEPRLVMRTPWLAGRVQNVMYCPLQHDREPFPDAPYFVDGGVTTGRPGPSYYVPWRAAQ